MPRVWGAGTAARMRLARPFCVTVDFQSLEDKQVTIRERDTMNQIRVPIKELKATLSRQAKW